MKRMEIVSDLEWSTMYCPCGKSVHGSEGADKWGIFEEKHKGHTNGECINISGDDWARILTEKPDDYVTKL